MSRMKDYNYYEDAPKPIKCKTSSCDGRMLYRNNVWSEKTKDWYERFVCWRCEREYVRGWPGE